ncbi:MAG: hypothetical protein U1E15_11260 [Hyphomicrobiales bacterium]
MGKINKLSFVAGTGIDFETPTLEDSFWRNIQRAHVLIRELCG